MAARYEAPAEVRELEKMINDFSYWNGLEARNVFHDFLRYVIQSFSIPGTPPLSDWKYPSEQNKSFYDMLAVWIQIMDKQVDRRGWYDAFGDLYMALTSRSGQQNKGQFFTPEHICNLMSGLTKGNVEEKPFNSIYDPACGSGRNLLSANHTMPRSYLVGWDIDYTCCLMTVCNMLVHGCVGEVVCINTLTMTEFRGAWLVNEALSRSGIPSVRHLNEREYALFRQADIPPYFYFLNQEAYEQYFEMRKVWQSISNLWGQSYNL